MTVDLTRDEIWFLKALRAAGERGCIVSAVASNAGLARLVEVQYVIKQPQSEWKTLYVITDRGRQALAKCTAIYRVHLARGGNHLVGSSFASQRFLS